MDIIKLGIIFLSIVIVMRFNKPLTISIGTGVIVTGILYLIKPMEMLNLTFKGILSWDTTFLVLAFYSITFLSRMLEKRGHILLAEQSLSNLFNSRRINAMIAPFIIGLLPTVGAVLIACPIVNNACGDYLTTEEKCFVTSYYRHISEAFLPTYGAILLALKLTCIDMTAFVIAMIPMVIVLFLLGYLFYVRKIPKEIGLEMTISKFPDVKNLFISLWSLALTIILILVFKIPVYLAVIPVIILSLYVNRFTWDEIKPMFKSAFEERLIFTTIIIMIFKEVLFHTGVIERLPGYFSLLQIPSVLIFSLIFFFGPLVAGAQTMIALALPLAYASIPNGGLALMILLMNILYISMQISPTHICLAVVVEDYGVSFIDLVKKSIPVLIPFIIIISLYSYLLFFLGL